MDPNKVDEASGKTSGDGDMASVMGFSGFGKKARTFDLDAIFEQTRRTAIERSQRILDEREKSHIEEEGESSKSVKPSVQRDKAAAASRKQESDSSSASDSDSDSDSELIGPPLPPQYTEQGEDDDERMRPPHPPVKKIPDTHEITLQHGTKTVSALGLDPSGARLVTGGYDYDVRFWDFAGMDQSLQAFRSLQPCNAQAKVLDRDGFNVMECIKGDQYIVDMANTKGHTAMLNCGCWHPKIKEEFMTCSNDGTVRTWDLSSEKKHKSVFKPRSFQGKKVHTKFHCRQAHIPGSDTSSLAFSYDGMTLASRGGDDTVKMWDIRNFRKPLNVKKEEGNGKLVFFDRASFQKVYEIEVTNASVIRCLWHPKLNQIMVGTGNGLAKVYYDPVRSHRGAKLCVVKSQRKEKQAETLTQDYIITPHALPMFREARQRSTRKQLEKDRLDPRKSHKPEPPVSGPGRGGRVAAHGGTLSSFIVKNIALDKTDDSNPREAILRHAKEASDNPYWVAPAYTQTQPEPVFAEESEEDEEAEKEPQWKKRKI
ncbi:WD repeat-containing protein 70 [Collichthys lucidus]|uniref:WD repeat-containing protein 70 n=1 Tax=Collichthys lucidus TaxID=240159 RepID=A0A4U5VAB9_COLLU|nr:WD repeat-containing protein 70 [Collichthys lucidus]